MHPPFGDVGPSAREGYSILCTAAVHPHVYNGLALYDDDVGGAVMWRWLCLTILHCSLCVGFQSLAWQYLQGMRGM
jgi:hypothetical protein